MHAPLVSFCVPTYNRGRYMACLLDCLVGQLAEFPYAYELVIADNASPDDTQAVVSSFMDRLPIRYTRHDTNLGGYPNWHFVMSQARGRYIVYLADDDSILGDQVADVIATMEADPALGVVYAPWLLYDLVAQQPQGQFYSVPRDLRIERDQHGELLDHILRHHIFPEIQIIRSDVFHATMPRINEHAFLAFMHSADYLKQGAVMIRQQPFYVSITRYFADEERSQLGTDEVEYAWDRYRGGLEYLLARSGVPISAEERSGYLLRINHMVAARMAVAVRLRHAKKRPPIDTYYLAMRLAGMGYAHLLPVPLPTLASAAMIDFLLTDTELTRGARQMVCVGQVDPKIRDYFVQHAKVPVEFVPDLRSAEHLRDALLFVFTTATAAQDLAPEHDWAERNVRLVREKDLAGKFGL